jgi:hypothetical protein
MVNECLRFVHVVDAHRGDGHRYVAHGTTKEDAFRALLASLPVDDRTNHL